MRARSAVAWTGSLCGLAALVAAWLLFWPIGIGGSTGYAVVIGTSMVPKLHRGDVALVRRASDYRVGDVVAYHSRTLGRIVLHRIVATRDGRFTFKGDANDFTDPGEAQRSDLIGRYWFKVGGAAPVLDWVHRPWHAALIAGLLGIALFGGGTGLTVGSRRRRRRRRSDEPPVVPQPRRAPTRLHGSNLRQPLAAVGVLGAVAFATLGVVSHGLPATRQVSTDRLYSQSGRFSYGTRVPLSAAYPTGRVASGEAVFTRLVQRLDVGFDWRYTSNQGHLVHGTATLAAEVSDGSGWMRRIELVPRTPFAGDHFALDGVLQIDTIEAMLRRLEKATGTHSGSYQIQLVPTIRFAGHVGGSAVIDVFAPMLALSLDQFRLQLTTSTDPAQPNSLARDKDTGGLVTEPNRIRLLAGRQLALAPARRAALFGGGASLGILLLALLLGLVRRPGDDVSEAHARYGRWIVRVAGVPPASRIVDLTELGDLARIAERYDRLILQDRETDVFFVEEDGVAYRWRPPLPPFADPLGRIADVVERRNVGSRPWGSVHTRPDEKPDASKEAS